MKKSFVTLNTKIAEKKTGYSIHQLFELTGIFGIYTQAELETEKSLFINCYLDNDKVCIEFVSDLIDQLYVQIDLTNKTIKNEIFISTGKRKGLAFLRLKSQVSAARILKFTQLRLVAFREYDGSAGYIGYIIWGKYGFVMSSSDHIQDYKNLLIDHKIPFQRLSELLKSKPGYDLWEDKGFTWLGIFKTSNNSTSSKIFSEILSSKS